MPHYRVKPAFNQMGVEDTYSDTQEKVILEDWRIEKIQISISQVEVIFFSFLSSGGHLAMLTFWSLPVGVGEGCATGIQWVQTRDAATYPTMQRKTTSPLPTHNKDLSGPKCQSC